MIKRTVYGLILMASAYAPLTPSVADEQDNDQVVTLDGYVVHGVNVYNNKALVDYSQVSPTVAWLHPDPFIVEIGAYNPGGENAETITDETDRSTPLATIRSFTDFFVPGLPFDPAIYNRPISAQGVNYFGYGSFLDRVQPVPFDSAMAGEVYSAKDSDLSPTVGDWEKISGQIIVSCRKDGTASTTVTVRNAFPNAAYTLWEIGVSDPLTENEQGTLAPFGGLPNVLVTDKHGCGYREIETPTCPTRACETGAGSCTSYISAFYHFDSQIYGGAPGGTFLGLPPGVIGSNQMVWPTTGTILRQPQNIFSPHGPGCNPGSTGNRSAKINKQHGVKRDEDY